MVCAEIWEQLLLENPVLVLLVVEACVELSEVSIALDAAWAKPVLAVDEDFEDVSDLRASIADDAAPMAGNMAELHNAASCGRASTDYTAIAMPAQKYR